MFILWLLVGVLITGCEFPSKPNFKTAQKVEAPLLYNRTFQFLGGSDALIDTTSGNMDSLFTIGEDDFILIVKEQDFDFGDLNEAIPELNVDPTDFESEVGDISLESFSSDENGNLGTADFAGLTGFNPNDYPAGTPIFAGQTAVPVNINIGEETDYFVSAVIKNGGLEISVQNNLGFNITQVDVVLKCGDNAIGSVPMLDVNHGQTSSEIIGFNEGDELSDLNVDVSVHWVAQNMQDNPGDLVVNSVKGVNLLASEVVAAVEPQDFSSQEFTELDDDEFIFANTNHYVELEHGWLQISDIINQIDIAITEMVISFPGIRQPPYNASDSLVITYSNIPRAGVSPSRMFDLSGYRIFAHNNRIAYNVRANTENTQTGSGSEARIIQASNRITSSVVISDLSIKEVFGVIQPQHITLGDDDDANGEDVLDLFNEMESQLTEIDGLKDLSDKLEGLEFTQPTLNIGYTTSVGVETVVYGAFLGVNSKGNYVYLHGLPGSEFEVTAGDPVHGLQANGMQLQPEQLIKFKLETVQNGGTTSGNVEFDISNSNVDEFLNNLPNEIRFIGKAVINNNSDEGRIQTPVEFSPVIEVGLPMAFKTTTAATFSDTTETTFNLPSQDNDDLFILSEGKIIIEYDNGLPLGLDVDLVFLDSLHQQILSLPLAGETIILNASGVDAVSRFASSPTAGTMQISLTREQLNLLNKTAFLSFSAAVITSNNEEVKVRASDSIRLTVRAEFKVEGDFTK